MTTDHKKPSSELLRLSETKALSLCADTYLDHVWPKSADSDVTSRYCYGVLRNRQDYEPADGQHRMRLLARLISCNATAQRDRDVNGSIVTDAFGQTLVRGMTFDTFFVDTENAQSLSKINLFDPACGSGHFLICAGPGAGKSHLLNAFADYGIKRGNRVRILSAQYLLWRFSIGLLDEDLRDKCDLDLLLVDDTQYFSGVALSSEFKRLFSRLIECSTWIVMAADRSPWSMESVDPLIQALLIRAATIELKGPSHAIKLAISHHSSKALRKPRTCTDYDQDEVDGLAKIVSVQPSESWTVFHDAFCSTSADKDKVPIWGGYLPLYTLIKEVADFYDLKFADMWLGVSGDEERLARDVAVYLLQDIGRLSLDELETVFGLRSGDVQVSMAHVQALASTGSTLDKRLEAIRRSFNRRLDEERDGSTSSWAGLESAQSKQRFGSKNSQ